MRFALPLLLVFVVPATCLADDPLGTETGVAAPASPRVQFDLIDGSRVFAKLVDPKVEIALRSSLGSVKVPLLKLARIQVEADRETTRLYWPNGDRLTGFVEGEGIEVETALGRLTIPLATVTNCSIQDLTPDVPREEPADPFGR